MKKKEYSSPETEEVELSYHSILMMSNEDPEHETD
jgi:hypothetical protein